MATLKRTRHCNKWSIRHKSIIIKQKSTVNKADALMTGTLASEKVVATSKRNASDKWNGFSYQGKVGILLGLIMLQDLLALGDDALDEWYIEYEVSEDIVIGNSAGTITKHQVKAKSSQSSHLYSTYRKAIDNFEIKNTPRDGRFLHTACNVINFKNNRKGVKLYTYPDGNTYCKLANDQVFIFCKDAVKKLRPDLHDNLAENICYHLMHIVGSAINTSHDSLDGSGKITSARVSLLLIKNCVFRSSFEEIADLIEESRLKNSIVKIWDEYREFDGGEDLDEERVEAVNGVIHAINHMTHQDVVDLLSFIHPDMNFLETGSHIQIYGFKEVFLATLLDCKTDYDCKGAVYNIDGKHFIPTTINYGDTPKNRKMVAKNIINNHNPNAKRVLFEKSSIINANIDGDILTLAELNRSQYSPNEDGLEHIMSYAGSSLINMSDAVKHINTPTKEDC